MTEHQRAAGRYRRMCLQVVLSALTVAGASTAAAPQTTRPTPLFPEPATFPLWNGPAPGAQGSADDDVPTITVFMPRETAGPLAAVVIAPGGSYVNLASNHEGRQPAAFFNSLGMAAFVLKYRLGPKYHHPIELGDAQRAIRTVRARASEWHIAPDRIGMMGFSAGGHLASTISTHFDAGNSTAADPIDRVSCRPDFAILGYPVITFQEAWTHQGSKNNLLGPSPDPALVRNLSNETQVTAQTPQTFIFQTSADTVVPAENAVSYYLALRKAGVLAELHVFRDGPHGVGLGMMDPALSEWPTLLKNWLRSTGVIK
jgi:acetyl esterase/lipase